MEQRQFENLESFVYKFELIYSRRKSYQINKYILSQTDSIFGGTPIVNFSTKFGVGPSPIITYGNSNVNCPACDI